MRPVGERIEDERRGEDIIGQERREEEIRGEKRSGQERRVSRDSIRMKEQRNKKTQNY